jgi:hypothetical protein
MQQANTSFSWIVTLVVVLVIVGAIVGLALSNTNLFNFNTSAADMRAEDQATAAEAAKVQVDQQVYAAQKQSEIAAIAANARAQANKAATDQQAYRIQQMAETLNQIAAAKQQEARQLTQVEVERRTLLAQVEIQREQQLAQIRSADQQRTEQAALTIAVIVVVGLIAIVMTIGGLCLGVAIWRLRLRQASRAPAGVTDAQARSQPTAQSIIHQRSDRQYWLKRRIEARANEIALRDRQRHAQASSESASTRYHQLPIAE